MTLFFHSFATTRGRAPALSLRHCSLLYFFCLFPLSPVLCAFRVSITEKSADRDHDGAVAVDWGWKGKGDDFLVVTSKQSPSPWWCADRDAPFSADGVFFRGRRSPFVCWHRSVEYKTDQRRSLSSAAKKKGKKGSSASFYTAVHCSGGKRAGKMKIKVFHVFTPACTPWTVKFPNHPCSSFSEAAIEHRAGRERGRILLRWIKKRTSCGSRCTRWEEGKSKYFP